MGDNHERKQKLAELETASERYVALGGVICLVAFFLLGWPVLIAWVGLAWGMQQFCQAMRGPAPGPRRQNPRRTDKSQRRCRP